MRRPRHGPPTYLVAVLVAAIALVGTRFAAARQPDARDLDLLAYALLLSGPALLLLRRRAPEVMLAGSFAVAGLYFARGYPWGPVVLALGFAIIFASAAGRRAFTWASAGAVVVVVAAAGIVAGSETATVRAAAVTAWLVVLVLIGEGLRARRERMAEVRRRRLEQEQRSRDEYRLALARDIHDVVAHSLSSINVQASVALHLAERDPSALKPALEAIKAASKDSLEEVRQLVGVLREEAPLTPSLRLERLPALVAEARRGGMEATLERTGTPGPLTEAQEAAVYRVVQEALTNAVRHADAAHVRVRLVATAQGLRVDIDDDGAGLGGSAEGNGLRGMRERAAGAGGSLELIPLEPGTRVRLHIPAAGGTSGGTPAETPGTQGGSA
ncbi:sensor histidine kinase [Arthrobacter sp. 35W]|uniref:sensor histidine kinase n=1 Tax=Arthrobacter sp. 35W TaxID=1132441 RepID=UPI0012DF7092|nr:sensor histidine kinase [Arthrobacter sp. 35W]